MKHWVYYAGEDYQRLRNVTLLYNGDETWVWDGDFASNLGKEESSYATPIIKIVKRSNNEVWVEEEIPDAVWTRICMLRLEGG